MKIRPGLLRFTAILALIPLACANYALAQSTITQWNFSTIGTTSEYYNNPAPTTGVGQVITLGMDNSYLNLAGAYSVTYDDVTTKNNLPGDPGYKSTVDLFRIRGTPNNGWANAAPEYSQGVQIDASTVGFSNIDFAFNWYCTTFGIRDLQVQYNLNVSNSAGWTNFYKPDAFTTSGTQSTYIAVSDNFYGEPDSSQYATTVQQAGTGMTPIVVNFSSVAGANNDPNFGVRLVSAYDSTGNLGNTYASAQLNSNYATVPYNNASGNWGFNFFAFQGTSGLATPVLGTPANNVYWALTGSTASGTWNTSTPNWSSTTPATNRVSYTDDGTHGVTFPDFGSSSTATITIAGSGVSPASITISNSTGTYNFTGGLIGGGGTLGLLKTNAGVAILSSPNSYTGGTNIFGGTLVAYGDSSLGNTSGTNAIGLDNGATLRLAGTNLISARNLNVYNDGGGTIDTNGFNASTSGVVVVAGPLTKTGGGDLTFSGNNLVFAGTNSLLTINSPGSVTFAGSGTTAFAGGVQLNGNLIVSGLSQLNFDNVATGGTGGQIQIQSAGIVTGNNASTSNQWVLLSNSPSAGLALAQASSGNSALYNSSGGLALSAGTITNNIYLNSNNAPFTKINVASGVPLSLATANNFIVGFGGNPNTAAPFAITGNIFGNSDVVLGSNTQYGGLGTAGGTLLLAGSNSYTGVTIMAGNGLVQLGSPSALPSTTDVIFDATASGASTTLDLNGFSQTINSLSANTSGSKTSITNNGQNAATLMISGNTVPTTDPYGGTIRDGTSTLAIALAGSGMLALSGSNTYSGGTTVSGGTLLVSNSGATGTGMVTVGGVGAFLATSGKGIVSLNSPVTINAGGALLQSGFNTGTGTLNIAGGLTLNANSSVNFDYGQSPSSRNLVYSGSSNGLNLATGANSVDINFTLDSNTTMQGIVPLFSWSGSASPSLSGLYLGSFSYSTTSSIPVPSSGTATTSYSFQYDNSNAVNTLRGTPLGSGNPDQIDLFNNSLTVAQSLTWAATNGLWNVSAGSNTVWSGLRNYYNDNDIVTFGNTANSKSDLVTITPGGVNPQAVTVSSSTAYTLTGGPISGYTSLTKTGGGLLTLASSNTYYLGTTITGGTLLAAAGDSSLGDPGGSVQLDSGATLETGIAGLSSSRTFSIGAGGNGAGGTFNTNGATSTLSGNTNITGTSTLTVAGSGGWLTLANTTFDSTGAGLLNVAGGTVQMINNINFSNSGSLTIAAGATVLFDNSNGSLGTHRAQDGWSSSVDLKNGGTFNGNLVIPAPMQVNFDNGTFSGNGEIRIQSRSSENLLSNSGSGANGAVAVNIHLNSSNLPFTPYNVTQASPAWNGPNGFVTTIGGGGGSSQSLENGVNFVIGGGLTPSTNTGIYGNGDVNFSTDGILGGGQGSVELAGSCTYTGATLINWNGGSGQGSGQVKLDVSNALPIGTDVIFDTLPRASASTLDLNGNNQQVGSLSCGISGASVTAGQNVLITNNGPSNSTSVLTVSGSNTPYYPFNGQLNNGNNGGALALTKNGPNTLTITGTNNGYSGDTTLLGGGLVFAPYGGQGGYTTPSIVSQNMWVTGGTLSGDAQLGLAPAAGGSIFSLTNLIVGPGGTVTPGLPGTADPGTLLALGAGTLSAGSTLGFDFAQGGASQLSIGRSLTLPSSGSVAINLTNEGGVTGTVDIITMGSLVGSTSALGMGNAPTGYSYQVTSDPNDIYLTLTRKAAVSLTWSGSAGNRWDVNSSPNFAGPQTFASTAGGKPGDSVVFDDSGAGGTVAIAANGVVPSGVTFNNSNTAYTLSGGPISGPTSLVLSGTGSVTLENENSYTGGTDVESGTLYAAAMGSGGLPIGSGLTVGANGTVVFGAPGGSGGAIESAAGVAGGGVASVPEPGTFALLAAGAALIAWGVSRRRKR